MPINRYLCGVAYLLAGIAAAVVTDAQELAQVPEIRVSAQPYVPAPAALRAETDLVEVGVVVRDHNGRAISGLKREDFIVKDQGSSRDLSYFAVETPGVAHERPPTAADGGGPASARSAPITDQTRFIALYFEDFGTNSGDLKRAQLAGKRFVKEGHRVSAIL